MNQAIKQTVTHLGGKVTINDYGKVSEANIEDFGPYGSQIEDYLMQGEKFVVHPEKLQHVLSVVRKIALFQGKNNIEIEGIDSLRHVQNLTLAGYVNFLLWNLEGNGSTGKIVLPTGQGKTIMTSLLAFLDNKKSIVISENNNGKSQFLQEASRIKGLKSSEISKESQNTSHMIVGLWTDLFYAGENNTIDFSQYSTIYIDEADVNGLSEKRQNILNDIIEKFGLKVIGISATEKQASGKQLDDFYKYDVLSFPMPESFPALYKLGELPDISFKDVLLSANLQLSSKVIRDTDNPEFELFIKNSDWIGQILNYHLEYNKGKKFILGMRNNKLNEFIIKVAESKGIKLIGLTGDDTQEQRGSIIQLLQAGKIDGIIGSRLTGRGLNIPECQVVYNSLITSSPQLFWQLGGRAARFDGGENKKEIITFLPKDIQHDTEKKGLTVPLCFQAFFQTDFFSKKDGNMSIKDDAFDLKTLQEEQIMSSDRVNSVLEMINKYGSFDGKPEILAKLILSLSGKISYNALVKYLGSVTGANMEEFYSIHEDISKSEDPYKQDLFKKYNKISKNYNISYGLDIEQEKKLISQYFGASDEKHKQKYLEKLLSYHYPIVIALACKMSQDEEHIHDLVQDGIEGIIKRIDNYKPIGRFSTFCKIQAFSEMNRSSQRLVAIPVNIEEILKKVHKILNREEGEGNQSRTEIEKKIMDELQISQKKVQKLLSLLNPEFEGVEQLESGLESPEDYLIKKLLSHYIQYLFIPLTKRQNYILRNRFGIGVEEEKTLEEIGKVFNVQRERIRQIETKLLKELRRQAYRLFNPYLNDMGIFSKDQGIPIKNSHEKHPIFSRIENNIDSIEYYIDNWIRYKSKFGYLGVDVCLNTKSVYISGLRNSISESFKENQKFCLAKLWRLLGNTDEFSLNNFGQINILMKQFFELIGYNVVDNQRKKLDFGSTSIHNTELLSFEDYKSYFDANGFKGIGEDGRMGMKIKIIDNRVNFDDFILQGHCFGGHATKALSNLGFIFDQHYSIDFCTKYDAILVFIAFFRKMGFQIDDFYPKPNIVCLKDYKDDFDDNISLFSDYGVKVNQHDKTVYFHNVKYNRRFLHAWNGKSIRRFVIGLYVHLLNHYDNNLINHINVVSDDFDKEILTVFLKEFGYTVIE